MCLCQLSMLRLRDDKYSIRVLVSLCQLGVLGYSSKIHEYSCSLGTVISSSALYVFKSKKHLMPDPSENHAKFTRTLSRCYIMYNLPRPSPTVTLHWRQKLEEEARFNSICCDFFPSNCCNRVSFPVQRDRASNIAACLLPNLRTIFHLSYSRLRQFQLYWSLFTGSVTPSAVKFCRCPASFLGFSSGRDFLKSVNLISCWHPFLALQSSAFLRFFMLSYDMLSLEMFWSVKIFGLFYFCPS